VDSSSNGRIDDVLCGEFESLYRLFQADGGKVVKNIRQRIAALELVEEGLYEDAGSNQDGSFVEDFRRDFDHARSVMRITLQLPARVPPSATVAATARTLPLADSTQSSGSFRS
jgi:hypothetical protein